MVNSDRLIEIIEDHESITQTLFAVHIALKSGRPLPNYIPSLHDASVTDCLGSICEHLIKKSDE